MATLGLGAGRGARSQTSYIAQFATGIVAWLLGFAMVALVAALIGAIARAGGPELPHALGPQSGIAGALLSATIMVALALALTLVFAFPAGVASAQPEIGGQAAAFLNFMLQFGPAVPTVAFGAAAFVVIAGIPKISGVAASDPLVTAAICLALFNAPIMTARFRAILREAGRPWISAAFASGATPVFTYRFAVIPRARRAIAGAIVTCAGLMFGETALVAVVLSACGALRVAAGTGQEVPLAVHLWQRLVQGWQGFDEGVGLSAPVASEALFLLALIVALRLCGRLMQRPIRGPGTTS
jgi:ABC-type phosphate transport system permease subunit